MIYQAKLEGNKIVKNIPLVLSALSQQGLRGCLGEFT